jgi:hypothetical protein
MKARPSAGFILAVAATRRINTGEFVSHEVKELARQLDLVRLEFSSTAEWRRQKAAEFPDDGRNGDAAKLLDRLAATTEQTPAHVVREYVQAWGDGSGAEEICRDAPWRRLPLVARDRDRISPRVHPPSEVARRRLRPISYRRSCGPGLRAGAYFWSSRIMDDRIKLFALRCRDLRDRVVAGSIPFIDAVDMAHNAAVWSGLSEDIGDAAVQRTMAIAFGTLSEGTNL